MAFSSPDTKQPGEKEMLDTGRHYMWTGLFGQKVTSRGDVRLLPLCGGCGAEAQSCNFNVEGRCDRCQRLFYRGPLFTKIQDLQEWQQLDRRLQRWENRYPITFAESTQTNVAAVADHGSVPMEAPPTADHEEPVADAPAVSAPTPRERECSAPPSSREEIGESAAPRPVVHQAASPPLPTRVCSDESPWEEERENKGDGAVKVPLSPVPEGSVANKGKSEISAIATATAPVAAKVSKRWGYYMPYAPEQVYLDVSLLLEDWIHEDILDNLKMDQDSLVQHDRDARRRAKDLVQEKLPMWWLGQTILRTYVCSICKRAPERHYSKDVPNNKGGYSEKPHPAYYVSFEDTKAWFHKMI
ncbi:hypothetical protein XELAEV_18034027mg [Xenopus laevis]|uniref:Uncharacterized protein n=1 Tax=Xenopus laevis TaxID=8355 RepID=A0A974CKF5_XENLA|nr:hypothetical protein XELAEV_18034027mg [Xenopus laevis]